MGEFVTFRGEEVVMILVTGATGKVGRQVVSRLLEAGTAVRALTREPESAGLPDGVQVVRGDLADPGGLGQAVDGVESVFLVWPTLAADHAAPETLDVIAEHARHVVYLSARGVPDDPRESTGTILGSHALIERLIEASGMGWTFLRPAGFASNTLGWAPQIRAGDVVRWFHGRAGRALIHERDIAAVGVRALTEDEHTGRKYLLTGPRTLTQIEQVAAIGEVLGRRLRFAELPLEAARDQLFGSTPPEAAAAIIDAHARMVAEPEPVTSTVADITGVPARTYREWVTDHADGFR
ncbi:MAG: SDR family oxidoreductase [Actinomadura sp.]